MGWLFTYGQTRKQLIHHLTTDWTTPQASHQCITHCTRGNVLWSVWENYSAPTGHIERYIRCDLMQCDHSVGWGYKDMDESMHPYYYTCPLKYLSMVPVASKEWRKGVLLYHKEAQLKRWAKKRQVQKIS
jgi:hypothetical protein